ncbi:MAG TPA: ABC transporter permease [Blastocatellia bacterium]|nr:ABC transporter permease [Blastocatellia bacterium]
MYVPRKDGLAKPYLWLIAFIGVIVPRRLRADWRQEWEAELQYRETQLTQWEKLDRRAKLALLWHSLGAFADALWLQPRRMEDEMFQDLRYGARMLVKSPGFTFVVALTLALGIGVNTAIFSVIEAVMLRPLPYQNSERLCVLWKSVPARNIDWDWTSYPTIRDWREQSRSFEDMAAIFLPSASEVTLQSDGGPERIQGSKVTGNFFEILGVKPLLGRAFSDDEARRGDDVVVLSYGFWQRRFGGDGAIVGRRLHLDNRSAAIIGVMPPNFQFPDKNAQLWLLLSTDHRWAGIQKIRLADAFSALARLKPGVTIEEARAEMDVIAGRLAQQYPATDANLGIRVVPLFDQIAGAQLRRALWVLGAAVLCVLLIACSNIASLLVARGAARRKELAVRAALGADAWRLLRQLATENILLSLLGGLVGLLFAHWALRALLSIVPEELPRADGIAINGTALAFAGALCLLTGVVFGLLPAAQITRGNLHSSLNESGRSASAGAGVRRARGLLVTMQFTFAIVLLTGAGLMVRSFLLLDAVKPGFDTTHLLTMTVRLPDEWYASEVRMRAFFEEAIQKIEQLPGVHGAAVGGAVSDSFRERVPNVSIVIEGRPATQDPERHNRNRVSNGYFRLMGIPLRQGRLFSAEDHSGSPDVAVISETMARRFWPAESPLGKRFKEVLPGADSEWLTVIGVVGDVVTNRDGTVYPTFYNTTNQITGWDWRLVVRTQSPPLELAVAVRRAVRSIDSTLPDFEITTVEQALAKLDRPRKFQTEMIGAFAVTALLLAALGLYGLMSYLVAQRTKEIGIRVALGARRRDVLKLVIGQGMTVALTGVSLGLAAAFAVTQLMKSLLFGVTATDPATFAGVAALLAAVALLACYLPARRASKVDPVVALRTE